MKTYKCVEPILHDKPYAVGSEIELLDKDAAPLLALGAISEKDGAASDKAPAPEGEARVAAIKEAIAKIDAGDDAAWSKDGKPKTEAIVAITGWSVNAAERNEIWETVKPAAVVAEINGMSAAATTETTA